jgi:hypothetical protein
MVMTGPKLEGVDEAVAQINGGGGEELNKGGMTSSHLMQT